MTDVIEVAAVETAVGEGAGPVPERPPSPARGRGVVAIARRHGHGIAAIAWGGAVTAVQAARLGHWIVDDAGISFAYARSFATGHGPVVQAGAAPVEGYSNPTWVALLAIGRLLGLFDHGAWFGVPDYVLFPKLLAMLCVIGILGCFYAACLALFASKRGAALVAAAAGTLSASVPSFIMWCFSGLENSLYALEVTALTVLLLRAVVADRLDTRRTAVIAGVLVALAGLTRPDGVIYLLAYPVTLVAVGDRASIRAAVHGMLRPAMASGLAFASLYGAYLFWRRLEFGRWVPNTAVAKTQETPNLADVDRAADILLYPGIALSLVAVALIVATWVGMRTLRRPLAALLVPLALATAVYCILNTDWMGQMRFATPVWALAALTTSVCAAKVLTLPGLRRRAVVSSVLVASLYLAADNVADAYADAVADPVVPLCSVAERNGEVFNRYADIAGLHDATLLLPDLGGTSLTSRLRLRDIAGLVDAPVADYYQRGDMNGLRDYVFDEMKPTFIQTHGMWNERLQVSGVGFDPRLFQDYALIYESDQIYGTKIGDSTDWIRKSALQDPSVLAQLQIYAHAALPAVERREQDQKMLGACTHSFTVGQTQKP